MRAIDLSITDLQNLIAKWAPKASGLSEVHLFGSALRVATPRDLDFVVVYDKQVVPPAQASRLRSELKAAVATVTALPCDVTLFTEQENSRNRFDPSEQLWPRGTTP